MMTIPSHLQGSTNKHLHAIVDHLLSHQDNSIITEIFLEPECIVNNQLRKNVYIMVEVEKDSNSNSLLDYFWDVEKEFSSYFDLTLSMEEDTLDRSYGTILYRRE